MIIFISNLTSFEASTFFLSQLGQLWNSAQARELQIVTRLSLPKYLIRTVEGGRGILGIFLFLGVLAHKYPPIGHTVPPKECHLLLELLLLYSNHEISDRHNSRNTILPGANFSNWFIQSAVLTIKRSMGPNQTLRRLCTHTTVLSKCIKAFLLLILLLKHRFLTGGPWMFQK